MDKSSEPPILAKLEAARNCFGLNATVLPGLGTFRTGAQLRGLCEMGGAMAGALLFCFSLFQAIGQREEEMTLGQALAPLRIRLGLGVILVLLSWFSGVLFAKKLFRNEL